MDSADVLYEIVKLSMGKLFIQIKTISRNDYKAQEIDQKVLSD